MNILDWKDIYTRTKDAGLFENTNNSINIAGMGLIRAKIEGAAVYPELFPQTAKEWLALKYPKRPLP